MSDITTARNKIHDIAKRLAAKGNVADADDLKSIVEDYMFRKPPARRAPNHSKKVTSAMRAEVKKLAKTTNLHSSEIASRVGVNPGRVSEIINS